MFASLLIVLGYLTQSINGECSWSVDGFTFDISSLRGQNLSIVSGGFLFEYTPCRQEMICDTTVDSSSSSLSSSTSSEDNSNLQAANSKYTANQVGSKCHGLAKYYGNETCKYSDDAYTIHYTGGTGGRSFTAKWKCGSSSYQVESCTEDTSNSEYTMTIKSSYACNGSNASSSSNSSTGLSLGWIIIIVFFGCVFLYCIIGYIICAKKNPDNGWGNVKANTPHLDFWCLVPKLTWAGCCVTKDCLVNSVNKMRGKGAASGGEYEAVE